MSELHQRLEEIRSLIKRQLKLKEGAKKIKEQSTTVKSAEQAKTLIANINHEISDLRNELNILNAQISTNFKPDGVKGELEEGEQDSEDVIENYKRQLQIETQVKDGIQKLLQAGKANATTSSSSAADNEILLMYQDSVLKIESLRMHILREKQKQADSKRENLEDSCSSVYEADSDGYCLPRLMNHSIQHLNSRLDIMKKLLEGAKGLKQTHLLSDDKKRVTQTEIHINDLERRITILEVAQRIRKQNNPLPSLHEDFHSLENYSKNATMSGKLAVVLYGFDQLNMKHFPETSSQTSTASNTSGKNLRRVSVGNDLFPVTTTVCLSVDGKEAFSIASKAPSSTCLSESLAEIVLIKNRELEIDIKLTESGRLLAFNSITLFEFLDGQEHKVKIPLEPEGYFYCKAKFIEPKPRVVKLARQKRIFAKSRAFNLLRLPQSPGIDEGSIVKILSSNIKKHTAVDDFEANDHLSGTLMISSGTKKASRTRAGKVKSTLLTESCSSPSPSPVDSKNLERFQLPPIVSSSCIPTPADTLYKPVEQLPISNTIPTITTTTYNLSNSYAVNFVRKQSTNSAPLTMSHFKLISVLGRGHFGKVMLAEHIKTKEILAIKALKKREIISRDELDMVCSEKRVFEVASNAKHPFLIQLYACFQTKDYIIFAMEYAAAGDMMTHIHMEIFTETRTIFYGACVLLGLQFLHNNGVIYRDLKLDNLLLDADGYAKLGDFGLCKCDMWHGSRTSTFCGTPEFIAPEILDSPSYTRSVDWWELGVLLYEMLIGESPFPGEDENEIFESILYRDVYFPPYLSTTSKSILTKLMCKDPNRRLGSSKADAEEIKAHTFFKSIDFSDLYARKIKPEYVPKVKKGEASFVDEEFRLEKPILTPPIPGQEVFEDEQKKFHGFDFVAKVS